jgi:hypothetical protein
MRDHANFLAWWNGRCWAQGGRRDLRHNPEVAQLLSAPDNGLVVERLDSRPRGFDEEWFYLWRVERTPPAASGA